MKKDHKWLRLNYVFTLTFTVLPFLAFITRGRLIEFNALDWHVISSSLWVSMKCSLIAMLIVILLGLPTGYYIARHSFKYKIFFDTLFTSRRHRIITAFDLWKSWVYRTLSVSDGDQNKFLFIRCYFDIYLCIITCFY